MFANVFILLKIYIIQKMNTTYFHISCHRVPLEPHSEQTSIPALSHFVLLGFNPENFEKIFKPLTLGLVLANIKNISQEIINKYA